MQVIWILCLARVFFVVAFSNAALVMSSLNVSRSSVVVIIGERVEMKCSVTENDSASWTYIAWKTPKEENIYLGNDIVTSMRSRYRIEKRINGQHDLIIDSVDLDHAGRYTCTTTMQQSLMNDVLLTVLGSDPVCDANASEVKESEEEQQHLRVSIWCSVNYSGDAFPIFNWTKSNTQKDIAANTTTSCTGGKLLTCTSFIIQQLNAFDNSVTFQCNITFEMSNNSESGYVKPWNYALYGPKNLSIVRYEGRLECAAEGNPAPTYKWIHVETNTYANGSILVLNGAVTSDKDHTFQCTAANIFADENINITIRGPTKDIGGTQDVLLLTVAIGGSLLLLLIIVIIVSCVIHRKRLKDDASDRPDVALNTDISPYDEVVFRSDRTSTYILEEDRLPERSDVGLIADNAVYSKVSKPKGRSNRKGRGNPSENSRPIQTQTQERKNFIGADGTEYAELSGVKPPDRKGELPRPPAFSRVDVYASIDHNGRAPPPPPRF